MATASQAVPAEAEESQGSDLLAGVWYWLGDWRMVLGVTLLLALILLGVVGSLVIPYAKAEVGWGPFQMEPSAEYPLGTDNTGRDILALLVHSIPASLRIGLIAGSVGIAVGAILGLCSGYFRGRIDTVIRTTADITLAIPSLMILIVIAAYVRATTIEVTALIVALFAWAGPTRAIRAQALSMRERAFIRMAKLNGEGGFSIVVKQILPNLLPYLAAGFVGSVSGGIMASVGIQLLGLGPLHIPNLGMMLQFAFEGAALYKGLWWWWGAPTAALMVLFFSLFLISLALDELANPRLRQRAR